MLNWINILHLHQPPTQQPKVLKKVVEESYNFILSLLNRFTAAKLTVNISGSLLEQLQEHDYRQVLENLQKLFRSGRLELTGTAMYHPILPLIPEPEMLTQINLNSQKLKEVFGDDCRPKGFFLPEMAYSKKAARAIKLSGFQWLALDEIHLPAGRPLGSQSYEIKGLGLKVLFRSRRFSKSFPPQSITENLEKMGKKFLVTAHDGEMYGHWHQDREKFSERIFNNPRVKTLTASEYLESLAGSEIVEPRPANWESTEEELKKNLPYAVWRSPDNQIQKSLWRLAEWVYRILKDNQTDGNWQWAKRHYDRGLASCYWWWASGRKIDVFSPVSWNPTEIEKGAREILTAVRSLNQAPLKTKLAAERRFSRLSNMIWQKHWRRQN